MRALERIRLWGGAPARRWQRMSTPARRELGAYVLLLSVALGMRLWDLGGRALHYDELLHAYYSWIFWDRGAYTHTPLTHGPFLFHVTRFSYDLFGSSDTVARLAPALFGTCLVAAPALLRRELGRSGALATALLLACSPTFLYFGRFLRNDIFMAVWTIALVAVMWRYLERPRLRLLVAWALLWSLAFSTKETAYINAGILGLALFVMAAPAWWRWVSGRLRLSELPPAGALLLVLVTLTLPLWAPLAGLLQRFAGIVLVNADPNHPLAETLRIADVETGAPAGGALYIAAVLVLALAGVAVLLGTAWHWRRWTLLALCFAAVWLPLHTSLFTNLVGFFTGLWGSLAYWIAQQPVERANQPRYFYLLLLATYEFLIVALAVVGAAFLLRGGRPFDRFLLYWAAMTLVVFSFAGERMPWLTVGIALPLAFAAGRSLGLLVDRVPWQRLLPGPAVALGIAGATATGTLAYALRALMEPEIAWGSPWLWLATAGLGGAGVLVFWWGRVRRLTRPEPVTPDGTTAGAWPLRRTVTGLLLLGVVGLLWGGTLVAAGRVSYSYATFEEPDELLVYSQTGQETVYLRNHIARLAQSPQVGGTDLRILVGQDDSFSWQWRWYLRDYGQVNGALPARRPAHRPPRGRRGPAQPACGGGEPPRPHRVYARRRNAASVVVPQPGLPGHHARDPGPGRHGAGELARGARLLLRAGPRHPARPDIGRDVRAGRARAHRLGTTLPRAGREERMRQNR